MFYAITIDGGAGSGKSTLAKNLQKELKAFVLIDTGAYYRWATYLVLEAGIDIAKEKKVYELVKNKLNLQFIPLKRPNKYESTQIYFDGEKINKKLYGPKVTASVPTVAKYFTVRKLVRKMLRDLAKKQHVLIAGRDIGTYVLPQAQVKIFMNPSIESRARRRLKDQVRQGRSISFSKLKDEISSRDDEDKNRKHSPLKKPDDALEIDNTYMLPSQTVKYALEYAYKQAPEIKNLKPIEVAINKPIITTSYPTSNSYPAVPSSTNTYNSSTTNTSANTSESLKELKKRLKEKYKNFGS